MPAEKKTTREAVIKAAVNIVRREGYGALNARSIAKKLGCSTQPIYNLFNNMDEIKAYLYEAAVERQRSEVKKYMAYSNYTRYKAYGLGFVRFAADEKELFRYLYMTPNRNKGAAFGDINLKDIISTMCDEYGYSCESAKRFHSDMTVYSYGLAIGMNLGVITLSDEEISERLQTEFIALTGIYGKPPKKPQVSL